MFETWPTPGPAPSADPTITFVGLLAGPSRAKAKVPERGVEPLCPFGQTGLSRPRIPFRHPGPNHDQLTGDAAAGPEHSATAVALASLSVRSPRHEHLTRVSP